MIWVEIWANGILEQKVLNLQIYIFCNQQRQCLDVPDLWFEGPSYKKWNKVIITLLIHLLMCVITWRPVCICIRYWIRKLTLSLWSTVVQTLLAKSLEAPTISDSSASKSMAVTPALLPVSVPLASTVAAGIQLSYFKHFQFICIPH